MATASATPSTSNAISGGDGNELLDLREAETSEQDSTAPENSSGAEAAGAKEPTQGAGGDGLSEALKAERRRSNQLEKELRGLRQQLTRFSEINPEEYARLQEAERQKQLLEQQLELRERQMEEAAAKRVAAVSAERDAAHERVQELRKERLLERAFAEAEGRTGGDGRGTFFQVFRSMLWDCFRLGSGKDGSDVLEPLDGQGQPRDHQPDHERVVVGPGDEVHEGQWIEQREPHGLGRVDPVCVGQPGQVDDHQGHAREGDQSEEQRAEEGVRPDQRGHALLQDQKGRAVGGGGLGPQRVGAREEPAG